jgi:hypothetical protein
MRQQHSSRCSTRQSHQNARKMRAARRWDNLVAEQVKWEDVKDIHHARRVPPLRGQLRFVCEAALHVQSEGKEMI